jgi:hypothetical protein
MVHVEDLLGLVGGPDVEPLPCEPFRRQFTPLTFHRLKFDPAGGLAASHWSRSSKSVPGCAPYSIQAKDSSVPACAVLRSLPKTSASVVSCGAVPNNHTWAFGRTDCAGFADSHCWSVMSCASSAR